MRPGVISVERRLYRLPRATNFGSIYGHGAKRWKPRGLRDLNDELAALEDRDDIHIDLKGRDPMTVRPIFLMKRAPSFCVTSKRLSAAAFDRFLRSYFDHFAFQSITRTSFWLTEQNSWIRIRPRAARAVDE